MVGAKEQETFIFQDDPDHQTDQDKGLNLQN